MGRAPCDDHICTRLDPGLPHMFALAIGGDRSGVHIEVAADWLVRLAA